MAITGHNHEMFMDVDPKLKYVKISPPESVQKISLVKYGAEMRTFHGLAKTGRRTIGGHPCPIGMPREWGPLSVCVSICSMCPLKILNIIKQPQKSQKP